MTVWPALRLDNHCGDMGPLLVEVVAPSVDIIHSEEPDSAVVVTTGWRGGPHLRIAADLSEVRFQEITEPRIRASIDAWFAENPIRKRLNIEVYGELCRKLAKAELADGCDLPPLMPDGTMQYCSYERTAPYDCSELADARDFFFAESFNVVVELTKLRLRSRAEWLMQLVELLATLGRIVPSGEYDLWPNSLLAHATSFLAMHPGEMTIFDVMTTQRSEAVAERVAAALSRAEGEVSHDNWWVQWLNALRRLDSTVRPIVAKNHAALSQFNVYGSREPTPSQRVNVPVKLLRTKTHLQYRLIINFVYAALPLMGVTPRQRAWLCYAISTVCKKHLTNVWQNAQERIDALMQEDYEGGELEGPVEELR